MADHDETGSGWKRPRFAPSRRSKQQSEWRPPQQPPLPDDVEGITLSDDDTDPHPLRVPQQRPFPSRTNALWQSSRPTSEAAAPQPPVAPQPSSNGDAHEQQHPAPAPFTDTAATTPAADSADEDASNPSDPAGADASHPLWSRFKGTFTKRSRTTSSEETEAKEQQEDEHPHKTKVVKTGSGTFTVPVPGGRFNGDRGMSIATKLSVYVLGGLLLLGSCGVGGMVALNAAAGDPENVLTADDASKYHLDTFPTHEGAAFASRYLRLCLWRTKDHEEARTEALNAMSSISDAPCPWEGDGDQRSVVDTTFTGDTEPVRGMEDNARYLELQVETSDGVVANYTVPVYFEDPDAASGAKVVGTVGRMPLTSMGDPVDDMPEEREQDSVLAQDLTKQYLPEFFEAWASGSESSLGQFLAPDSSSSARAGLGGLLKDPKVRNAYVYPGSDAKSSTLNQDWEYDTGDTVDVEVVVDFTNDRLGGTETQTYRLTLELQGSHWFVLDIRGGALSLTNTSEGKEDQPEDVPNGDDPDEKPPASASDDSDEDQDQKKNKDKEKK